MGRFFSPCHGVLFKALSLWHAGDHWTKTGGHVHTMTVLLPPPVCVCAHIIVMAVDVVTVFEALFVLYVAVLPLVGIIALIRHQFWSHSASERWLGQKKYIWFYVVLFSLLAGATAFLIAARVFALLVAVGDSIVWGVVNNVETGSKTLFAVYASVGFVGSTFFAMVARTSHVGGDKSESLYTVMSTLHLLTYVVAFLSFTCELICIAMLSYGGYKSYANPSLMWFTFPYPVIFGALVVLMWYHRVHPTATDSRV